MTRYRKLTASIAVAAAMSFGTGIAVGQDTSAGTNAADTATTGAASGASWTKQENVQVVPVKMKMGTIGFDNLTIEKEKARFEIENVCTVVHAFELEGKVGGKEVEFATGEMQPGDKAVLIVHMPPGEYEAYCPVGNHAERGMRGKVVFKASEE